MPTWNWKKIGLRVVGLVAISFILAILTDVLFMAVQPVRSYDSFISPFITATPPYFSQNNLPTLTTDQLAASEVHLRDSALQEVKKYFQEGDLLERRIACRLLENRVEGEFILVVSRTSQFSQVIRSGSFEHSMSVIMPVIFGDLVINEMPVIQNYGASGVLWSDDSTLGTLTLSVHFDEEISGTAVLRLNRFDVQKEIPAEKDQFQVSFANWRTLSVQPASDFASGVVNTYDMNKHPGEEIYFEAASVWPTSTPTVIPTATITPTPSADQTAAKKTEDVFTRQEFMQKLDDILEFPPIGSMLFSIIEGLPLLIFCLIGWKWKFKETKKVFYDNLIFLTLGLLIFHFSFYFLNGLSSWWYDIHDSPLMAYFSNAITNFISPFFSFFHTPLFGLGYYWEGVALLGILLPLLLLELGKELEFQNEHEIYFIPTLIGVWRKGADRATWRLPRFITVLFLIALVLAPLLLIYAQSDRPLEQWTFPLGIMVLPVIGILGIFLWLLWKNIYKRLNGVSPAGEPAYLSWLVLLFCALYSTLYIDISLKINHAVGPEISWGWFILNILLGFLLIYSITKVTLAAFNQQKWLAGSRFKHLAWGLGLLSLVIPLQGLMGNFRPADQFGIFSLASYLDDFIKFIWLAGVVYLFYLNGTKGPEITPFTRLVGILAGSVMLVRFAQDWFYIPITFLVCFFALKRLVKPAEAWDELKQYYEKVFKDRLSLLEEIVRLNTAESSYEDLHKEYAAQLGKGTMNYTEFREKVELRRKELDLANEAATINNRPYRDIALTFGPKETAWDNGLHGALWGFALALPWIGLGLFEYLTSEVSGPYPILGLLRDLLNLSVRWVGLGFILGYFYPYLRGKNGLMKALGLWIVMFVSVVPYVLIFNSSAASWQAFLFVMLQLLVHCILLGLIAFDFMTLRQGYREWQMLFEVHGLPSLGVSASTFVISLATSAFALFQNKDQVWAFIKMIIAFFIPDVEKLNLP